jgi:excisionase family DNA binding protein
VPMSEIEGLWEATDVAKYLGMTTGWVYAEARGRRIPHVKLGRYYRFRKEAIDQWLSERERERSPIGVTRRS